MENHRRYAPGRLLFLFPFLREELHPLGDIVLEVGYVLFQVPAGLDFSVALGELQPGIPDILHIYALFNGLGVGINAFENVCLLTHAKHDLQGGNKGVVVSLYNGCVEILLP